MANPAPHTAGLFLVYIKSTTGVLRRQAATIQIAFRGSRLFPSWLCHLHHLTSWVTISMVTGSSHRRKRAWRVPCGSFCRPVLGVAHWMSAHNSYVGHNSVTWPVPNIKVQVRSGRLVQNGWPGSATPGNSSTTCSLLCTRMSHGLVRGPVSSPTLVSLAGGQSSS